MASDCDVRAWELHYLKKQTGSRCMLLRSQDLQPGPDLIERTKQAFLAALRVSRCPRFCFVFLLHTFGFSIRASCLPFE